MTETATPVVRTILSTDQIQKRVKEIGRQISDDYRGMTVHALALLENGFMFMADLAREMDVPMLCQFIKPQYRHGEILEIFFSHGLDIRDQHVLLVEGIIHSGLTSEFLMSDMRARGAASVKVATLLDRQASRRVQLQPDYFGFLVDEAFLVGYGLGSPEQMHRNLPFVGVLT
jgi:hypoxanthine phosphoribosyltransferase